MAVREINGFAPFPAPGNLVETESGAIKLGQLGRVLGENRYVSNPWHGVFSFLTFLFPIQLIDHSTLFNISLESSHREIRRFGAFGFGIALAVEKRLQRFVTGQK
jgi:hypothetical protein